LAAFCSENSDIAFPNDHAGERRLVKMHRSNPRLPDAMRISTLVLSRQQTGFDPCNAAEYDPIRDFFAHVDAVTILTIKIEIGF
jgi:hypothetical protein